MECCWCGRGLYDSFHVEAGPGDLCWGCWNRLDEGLPPPRQPDARARCAQWLRLVFETKQEAAGSSSFPQEVRTLLAAYLVHRWMP